MVHAPDEYGESGRAESLVDVYKRQSTNTIKSRKNHKTVPKGGRPIPRPIIHFTMSAGNPNKAMETKIQNK